jgi:hypothetical protein
MTQEARDITTKKQAAVPSTSLFEADAKLGLENMDQDDLALPFLKLLQNSSDETKKKHASYVDGAEPGMFYNTVTKKLYDGAKGIEVIPCYYKLTFPEWAPFERKEISGNFTWYGYAVKLLRKVDNVDLYQHAKAFHASLKSVQAKAAKKDDINF